MALNSTILELYYPLLVPKKGEKLSKGGVRFRTDYITLDALSQKGLRRQQKWVFKDKFVWGENDILEEQVNSAKKIKFI